LTFPDQRWQPVKKPTGGVTVVLDTQPDEPREIIELEVSKQLVKAGPSEATIGSDGEIAAVPHTPVASGAVMGAGAAAAAGVLTAVDEDEEGAEEAPVPDEFDYISENEGGEE